MSNWIEEDHCFSYELHKIINMFKIFYNNSKNRFTSLSFSMGF